MIDIKEARQNPERIKLALRKRGVVVDVSRLLELDAERRTTLVEIEALRSTRNSASKEFAQVQRQGGDVTHLRDQVKTVADRLAEFEGRLTTLDQAIKEFIDPLPNLADDDVPAGGKEANRVLREVGEKPAFSFAPKDHVQLARSLNLIDYERGTKLGVDLRKRCRPEAHGLSNFDWTRKTAPAGSGPAAPVRAAHPKLSSFLIGRTNNTALLRTTRLGTVT